MKKYILIGNIIAVVLCNVLVNKCVMCAPAAKNMAGDHPKQSLRMSLNYLQFELNDDSAYAELQMLIMGNSLQYVKQNGKYVAAVKVNAYFIPASGADTISTQAYVYSNTYTDSATALQNNIYDLIRIPMPKGEYKLYITANDIHQPGEGIRFSDNMDLRFVNNMVQLSSIQPISYMTAAESATKYTKHGWEYVPYFSTFYSSEVNSLVYWLEIYHTNTIMGDNAPFKVVSYIVSADRESAMADTVYMTKEKSFTAQNMVFMMQNYSIESLPSGNYYLKLEVRDSHDTLHAYTSHFFQRSNIEKVEEAEEPSVANMFSYDTLKRYFDYISVLATPQERTFIDNFTQDQVEAGGWFFYNFWKSRNEAAPHEAWYDFYFRVQQVNNNYSTLKYKGYKTDRGQCYLKYGPPTEIEYHNFDGNTYPYEIWRYDHVPNGQVNVFFVFYSLDRTTKDYRLLHSSVIGEVKFPNWEAEVQQGKALIIENTDQTSQ